MQIGYKLATEAFGPKEIIRQATAAERAGFDFVEISDHFHPWLDNQGHSAFTWSLLGAMAERTERIGLATGVTCPSFRYHPAIITQAAVTVALMSEGRFTLGVGAGERLNEHVVGRKFPGVRKRHEMLREALEIIRLLWQGGYRSYDVRQQFACGPDVARHLEVAQQFVDAGFDHIVLQNAGPDPDGFLDFFTTSLADRLRSLTPQT